MSGPVIIMILGPNDHLYGPDTCHDVAPPRIVIFYYRNQTQGRKKKKGSIIHPQAIPHPPAKSWDDVLRSSETDVVELNWDFFFGQWSVE